MNYTIMIMGEHNNGEILPVTLELISSAHIIATHFQAKINVVLPGLINDKLSLAGVDLLVINSPDLVQYSAEGWQKAALIAAEEIKPDIIIIAHTSTGYDYAPRLAAQLNASCITSVSGIEVTDGAIAYRRSSFHGKLDVLYAAGKSPLVITVLPGAFSVYVTDEELRTAEVIDAPINLVQTSNIEFDLPEEANTDLADANVIISAGRGIGKEENMALIRSLASCFNRSAIAGSRVACDNGWIKYNAQVGVTGKKVAPPLYIACGISGSVQHLAGMKDSKTIVSINRDPEAAIFRHSDICIVEDLEKFIPIFINEAQKRRHN